MRPALSTGQSSGSGAPTRPHASMASFAPLLANTPRRRFPSLRTATRRCFGRSPRVAAPPPPSAVDRRRTAAKTHRFPTGEASADREQPSHFPGIQRTAARPPASPDARTTTMERKATFPVMLARCPPLKRSAKADRTHGTVDHLPSGSHRHGKGQPPALQRSEREVRADRQQSKLSTDAAGPELYLSFPVPSEARGPELLWRRARPPTASGGCEK